MSGVNLNKEDALYGHVAIGRMIPPDGIRPAFDYETQRRHKNCLKYLLI